ncbi:hypothetical protein UFOVP774_3 [uncultured Caudovirales phage]|uniref:Uncharacterized protein n=1 Tax=uncultured Caudovirales phage TaxID=2100421 RepID=A0A6J5NNQ0_9CAUD|nr:hypothetical protein UFOVP774_3 [uncultured Caudovirales phage]
MLIAGAVFIAFCTGWTVHGWKYDANLKKALQDTIELQQAYDRYAREVAIKFEQQQAEQVVVYRTLKGKVKDVTDNRICFADSNAIWVWNNALTGMPKTTTGTTKTPTSTDTATDTEVLTNVIENFEQAKQIRDQLNALIDWYENSANK